MKLRFAVCSFAILSCALSGCAICETPFDYCNSVIGPNGLPNCNFWARRNSLYCPMDDSPAMISAGPTPARGAETPAPANDDYAPQDAPEYSPAPAAAEPTMNEPEMPVEDSTTGAFSEMTEFGEARVE